MINTDSSLFRARGVRVLIVPPVHRTPRNITLMSEGPCGIIAVACVDICAGIILDFMSLRAAKAHLFNPIHANYGLGHGCTESLCKCCGCCREPGDEIDSRERDPLISQPRTQQPEQAPQMQVTER